MCRFITNRSEFQYKVRRKYVNFPDGYDFGQVDTKINFRQISVLHNLALGNI